MKILNMYVRTCVDTTKIIYRCFMWNKWRVPSATNTRAFLHYVPPVICGLLMIRAPLFLTLFICRSLITFIVCRIIKNKEMKKKKTNRIVMKRSRVVVRQLSSRPNHRWVIEWHELYLISSVKPYQNTYCELKIRKTVVNLWNIKITVCDGILPKYQKRYKNCG